MMLNLLTHICVNRPQWVKISRPVHNYRYFAGEIFNRSWKIAFQIIIIWDMFFIFQFAINVYRNVLARIIDKSLSEPAWTRCDAAMRWCIVRFTADMVLSRLALLRFVAEPCYNTVKFIKLWPHQYGVSGVMLWRDATMQSLIAMSMGAHLGPTGPRWAPCWPHEFVTWEDTVDCTDYLLLLLLFYAF